MRHVGQWFSKGGSRTSNISIFWRAFRNANSQTPNSRPSKSETLGMWCRNLDFRCHLGNSGTCFLFFFSFFSLMHVKVWEALLDNERIGVHGVGRPSAKLKYFLGIYYCTLISLGWCPWPPVLLTVRSPPSFASSLCDHQCWSILPVVCIISTFSCTSYLLIVSCIASFLSYADTNRYASILYITSIA